MSECTRDASSMRCRVHGCNVRVTAVTMPASGGVTWHGVNASIRDAGDYASCGGCMGEQCVRFRKMRGQRAEDRLGTRGAEACEPSACVA